MRYKRDYVHALHKYDSSNDGIYNDDNDNESESNAACARQKQASDAEGGEGDQHLGDGGFHGDDDEVTLGNSPNALGEDEPEAVSYTHLTLPTNREV